MKDQDVKLGEALQYNVLAVGVRNRFFRLSGKIGRDCIVMDSKTNDLRPHNERKCLKNKRGKLKEDSFCCELTLLCLL